MSAPVLGLEIGPDLLCGVVGGAPQPPGPTAVAVQSYAPGGEAAALAALLQTLGWRRGRVALGVAPGMASLRRLQLPFAHNREVLQVISQELADQFPWPLEELLWDHRVVHQDAQGSDILALALRRDWLHTWLPLLRQQRLALAGCDLASMALAGQAAAACRHDCPCALLLDAGPGGLTLALLVQGEVRNLRELPWPSAWIDDHILSRPPQGIPRWQDDLLPRHLPALGTLVRQTLACWQLDDQAKMIPQTHLVPAGWLAVSSRTGEALARELALTLRPWTPLPKNAVGDQRIDPSLRPLLGRATALAQSLDGAPRFSLPLPRAAGIQGLMGRRGRLAAILVLIVLLGAAAAWGWQLRRLSLASQRLDTEMTRLLRETFPATGRVVDPLQQFLAQVQAARAGGPTLPELAGQRRVLHTLAALTRILAQDPTTRLSTFALERDQVQLRGEAASYRAVQQLRDRLAVVPGFAEVAIVSAASAGQKTAATGQARVVFQLKFRLRPST
ncbi:MAG: hypothetical protein BWK76_01665 [Desulfobulbaceae bacterium A2]|nr:MAG: hypothetical protein BWK76_01665 [Desulfobulbaceae bacterium A2]